MITNSTTRESGQMSLKGKEKYIEDFVFPYCDETAKYEKVAKIGQGTFGYTIYSFLLL